MYRRLAKRAKYMLTVGLSPRPKVLRLRPHGMFSNVNEVIQHLHTAEQLGYQFVIDWSASCYRDDTMAGDPWQYYFDPCFELSIDNPAALDVLPTGAAVGCTRDSIITPRVNEGLNDSMLLPPDRRLVHAIINKYLAPKAPVKLEIENFKSRHFDSFVIGLHIRGAGKNDSGVPELRAKHTLVHGVPFELYFAAVDKQLNQKPDAKVFVCSDSSRVIQQVKHHYGERVVSYDATRSVFGEMHANHPENGGAHYSGYKLGLDVVVEAYLLSLTDCFIHGNSNVVNFVLCQNPDLENEHIYRA